MIALFSLLVQYVAKDLILKAIEKLLVSVIGASTGFQVWIVAFLTKNAYKQVIEPLINASIVEGKYQIEVQGNKVVLKKIEEATNVEEHFDAIDDLLD